MRFLVSFVTLAAFWWLCSGQTAPFLLKSGLVVSLAVAWLSTRMGLVDEESQPLSALPRLALYVPWLLWQVVLSNWDVVRRVWSPGLSIAPAVIEVPCALKTGFGRATYATSITLTPGTVTIETGKDTFLVHALHDEAAAGLENGDMHARLMKVEGSA
ncbi:MAG: Na+/H+ antiporter subunit E [Planctomycetota bacterium]|nr:Na+/H+ antiporter subunit E [Planctomycetota bacterium]